MPYIAIAYEDMAYRVLAFMVTAYRPMDDIVMADIVMASIITAYVVMAKKKVVVATWYDLAKAVILVLWYKHRVGMRHRHTRAYSLLGVGVRSRNLARTDM